MFLKFDINSISLEEQNRLFLFLKEKFEKVPGRNLMIKENIKMEILDVKLKDLDLFIRAYNLLNSTGIISINDLRKYTRSELLNIEGFGNRCLKETEYILSKVGLELKKEE
jgi:DNA-directed RNA polymerase alpha subunit